MKLYRFDNSGVTETAFASDRDDLEDLLVENFGADLSKLAEEYDLTEEAYHLAWSEVDPSESLTVNHAYPVWTPTVAGSWRANRGPYPSVGICAGAAS